MSDPHNATWAAWTLHDMEKTAHSVGEWCPREAKQRIIQQAIDATVAEYKALLQTAHEAYESLGETLEVTRKEYDARLSVANETIKRLAEAVKRLVWAADNCIGAHGIESGSIVDASEYGRAALALVPKESTDA